MKTISQRHPRLYVDIFNKNDDYCELKYHENQYDDKGVLKFKFILIPSESIIETTKKYSDSYYNSSNDNMRKVYSLNVIEFKSLKNFIKKQEKVVEIYLKKKKKDQHRIISSSLVLLYEFKRKFDDWFLLNSLSASN